MPSRTVKAESGGLRIRGGRARGVGWAVSRSEVTHRDSFGVEMKWIACGLLALTLGCAGTPPAVGPVPIAVRESFRLDQFYAQHIDAEGLPIVASAKVEPLALIEARAVVEKMCTARPEILPTLGAAHVRLVVMAYDEFTTDIPEHSDLAPAEYWDVRARGLGATPVRPAVSCGEENLLGLEGDPYSTESILVHEFAHAIHEMALCTLDPTFDDRLKQGYQRAMQEKLWDGTYAATNRQEYFAEGTQSWFDTNREDDAVHNHVDTRDELRTYDPRLAALCAEVYGDLEWRYVPPSERDRLEHFEGFDRATAPKFVWPEEKRRAFDEHQQESRDDRHSGATDEPAKWQRFDTGTGALLLSVCFVNGSTGFAVGGNREDDPSVLVRTKDGGRTWERIPLESNSRLYAIHFPTPEVGYAVGIHQTVVKTIDGGESWQMVSTEIDGWYASVHFTTEETGFVVGGDQAGKGLLIRTTDGGKTWRHLDLPKKDDPFESFRDVLFVSKTTGFVVGQNGVILNTIDAGESWTAQTSGSDTWLRSIGFIDDKIGFVVGTEVLLKTVDGGQVWSPLAKGRFGKLNDVVFLDADRGYIADFSGSILETVDGGETWSVAISPHDPRDNVGSFHFPTSTVGYASAANGIVLKIELPK